MPFIFEVSFYTNKRYKISHTDMYYLKAEHTHWAFNRINAGDEVCIVKYIEVFDFDRRYIMAVENSKIADKEK